MQHYRKVRVTKEVGWLETLTTCPVPFHGCCVKIPFKVLAPQYYGSSYFYQKGWQLPHLQGTRNLLLQSSLVWPCKDCPSRHLGDGGRHGGQRRNRLTTVRLNWLSCTGRAHHRLKACGGPCRLLCLSMCFLPSPDRYQSREQ